MVYFIPEGVIPEYLRNCGLQGNATFGNVRFEEFDLCVVVLQPLLHIFSRVSDKCQVIGYIEKCQEIGDRPIMLITHALRSPISTLAVAGSGKGVITILENEEPLNSQYIPGTCNQSLGTSWCYQSLGTCYVRLSTTEPRVELEECCNSNFYCIVETNESKATIGIGISTEVAFCMFEHLEGATHPRC